MSDRFAQPRVPVSQSATPRLVKTTPRPLEPITPRIEEVATPRIQMTPRGDATCAGDVYTPRPGAEPYKTKTYRTQQVRPENPPKNPYTCTYPERPDVYYRISNAREVTYKRVQGPKNEEKYTCNYSILLHSLYSC